MTFEPESLWTQYHLVGGQGPLGPRVLPGPPEVLLMSEYSPWAKCQCSKLHPSPRPPSPHMVPSSLTYCGANALPVNSVFFHPSELSLDCDLGASSCRCLKSSSALFPPCSPQHHPCLLAALDFTSCQLANLLGRQAPQLTVESVVLNPSCGKKKGGAKEVNTLKSG